MSEDYKQYEDFTVLNSELAIYRDARTRKRNYIVRIMRNDGRYILRSTGIGEDQEGAPLKAEAIRRAYELWEDIKLRERKDLPMRDYSLQQVLNHWLEGDGASLTPRRRKQVARYFEKIVAQWVDEVVGSPKGLELLVMQIKQHHLNSYLSWRLSLSGKTPATSSLMLEIGNFNVVMRHAKRNNRLAKDYLLPTLKKSRASITKKEV